MFILDDVEQEVLQLAIALPSLESVTHGKLIPIDILNEALRLEENLDALFVSDLPTEQFQEISRFCHEKAIELVVFDHPLKDQAVIKDVVLNLADKFYSDEMPANVGIADIRNLNQSSDTLLAFNSMPSALEFMTTSNSGVITGGVLLVHGDNGLGAYKNMCEELLKHFSEESFLCSSLLSTGRSECTILLGVKA